MSRYLLLFFLGISASVGLAQQRLSLAQAIKIGLRNNFQIQIANKNLEIAENNNNWKAAGRYPTIDLNVYSQNGYYREDNPAAYLGDAYTWSNVGLTGNIDLNYTLFDGHQAKINKKRFEELERQGRGAVAVAVENSIRQIINSYYQTLIEQERLKVVKEVLGLSIDRAAYERKRQEYGSAAEFEILQSTDALLNDSTNLLLQENAVTIAMRNLNLAMAESKLEKKYRLTDSLNFEPKDYHFTTLQRKMFSNNKELQQLKFENSLADIATELEAAYRKPTLTLGAGVNQELNFQDVNAIDPFNMREEIGNTQNIRTNGYLNLTASYRLYDGKTNKRNVENANIRASIAQLNYEDKKQQLLSTLKNTLETYNNQIKLLRITEKLVSNAQQNMTISADRLQEAQISPFDFRAVQIAFINASQARISALFNLRNTETELIQLMGGLVR